MTASYEDALRSIAVHLKCSICFDMFTEPVSLECGHSYCFRCITGHLKRNARRDCPHCRAQLRADCKLYKNVTISAILELQQAGGREVWDKLLAGSEEQVAQNGSSLMRDGSASYEEVSSSSLDREEGSQCAENSASRPSVTQINEMNNLESDSEENRASESEDPDSRSRFSQGGTSAADVLSAEFVPLSFSPQLGHRRLVFLPQRQRLEVRQCPSLRKQRCYFEACQWMAEQEFTTGRCYWDVETSACSGWAVGVAYTDLGTDERLGRSKSSWCIEWSSGRFSAWHDGSEMPLKHSQPSRLRVLLDMDSGHVSFRSGGDEEAELYDVQVEFRAPVRPVFWLFGTKPGNALSFPRPRP